MNVDNLDSAVSRLEHFDPADIEFIEENGGGPGVRLRTRQPKSGSWTRSVIRRPTSPALLENARIKMNRARVAW
jgi:hypothetical protein